MIFEVLGEPQGKARPRVVKNKYTDKSHTYTPDKTVAYEESVKFAYMQAVKGRLGQNLTDKPLSVMIDACFAIPKSTSKVKRIKMLNYEIYPTKKPDCDNIAKIILDSLNKIAFKDDSQVVELIVRKMYADVPRVIVEISEADLLII